MAYGDRYKTKLIIDVTVDASSEQRANRRWEEVLQKIKYQTGNVNIDVTVPPNWTLVEKEENDNASA